MSVGSIDNNVYPNQIRYTNLEEVTPVHRGDDIVIPQPYAGIAVFRDGKYIVAGKEKGRLVLVGADDLVIASCDPLSLRHDYDKLICYGIAMHVSEESLYLLVGEEGSTDLYITRIEILDAASTSCSCGDNCSCDPSCGCHNGTGDPYTNPRFKWNPAFDIRLPSMTAKNSDYNDFKPIYWGIGYTWGGHSPNTLQWVTHLLRKKQPDVINDWTQLHDDLAVNLADFPMLGPILPEYKPCITGVGARVMVSAVNVQVYQCSFDMQVWYPNYRDLYNPQQWANRPENISAMWRSTLRGILKRRKLIDETIIQPTLDSPAMRTPPVLEDWFPEGKDKSWWVEPFYGINKYGEIVSYHGCILHQKVTFQYPFLASSVVTVYPDLGMIEGISHVGSGTVCAVPRDVDVQEDFSWARYYPYKASLDYDHNSLNKYMATGIMAAEADIDLLLSPLEYYIPSNVLAWADGIRPLKWTGAETETITALTDFMEDFWLDVYLYQQKLDPIAYVRRVPQDTSLVKIGSLKENALCKTRRDGARIGTNSAEDYQAGSLVYPWSTIDGVQSACTEICSGVVMAVTPTKIYRGDIALHKLISIYNGRIIGEGLDIYIGKVLVGKEKIVKVKFQHAGYSLMQLRNIKIEIIPDMNFPYWQYVELSLDKTTWSESIFWNKRQLMPVSELYNADHYEFEFWVKVLCSSPYEDPKPVKIKTTYERTGS